MNSEKKSNQICKPQLSARISALADQICQQIKKDVDFGRLYYDRDYVTKVQKEILKPLLSEKLLEETIILQLYFQFKPQATPFLAQDEFAAGVCLEKEADGNLCEHNTTYIRDFQMTNTFLKWWFYESLRIKSGGWTRPYYDPYLAKEVVTYSLPVSGSDSEPVGVLGIDINSNDFRDEMNQRLVENIKDEIETIKKDYAFIGDKELFANRYIDVNTFEIFSKNTEYGGCIVQSPAMLKALDLADKAAQSGANVLLQGETGVGKDFMAHYIHSHSSFSEGPYLNVNCASLPESLLESEFFGYGKGSFTGAQSSGKAGFFEAADNGTIFLNEIGDIALHLQSKFLNVIQNKEVTRIGETSPVKTNFRLIAATNRDLYQLVVNGAFRQDLFYRLHVIVIDIPPLRERREDLYSLLNYFYEKNTKKYNVEKKISKELFDILMNYSWPGNIRELENLIERLVVTSSGVLITEEDLPQEFKEKMKVDFPHEQSENLFPFKSDKDDPGLKELLEEKEREIVLQKYKELGSSYKVAEALKISQSQAWKKIKKYSH